MRKKNTSALQRFKFRPVSTLGLATISVMLWGLSPLTVVSGVVLGWLILVVFPLPPIYWEGRLRPIGFLKLVWHLLADLVVSSVRMVALAFAKKVELNAGIVRVDLDCDNDLYQVQVAEIISLVPGTVVVEVVKNPRRLYLHAIDMIGPNPTARIQKMCHDIESRVIHAFGSKEEIAEYREIRARGAAAAAAEAEHPELEVEES